MSKQTWTAPNFCNGLVVVAVSAMSCALVFSGVLFLILLR
jgi:hypothetical protein